VYGTTLIHVWLYFFLFVKVFTSVIINVNNINSIIWFVLHLIFKKRS
jgi:hypothetical protein